MTETPDDVKALAEFQVTQAWRTMSMDSGQFTPNQVEEIVGRTALADRSAREERIRQEAWERGYRDGSDALTRKIIETFVIESRAAEDERDRLYLDALMDGNIDQITIGGWLGSKGAMLPADRAALRARQPEPQRQEGGV